MVSANPDSIDRVIDQVRAREARRLRGAGVVAEAAPREVTLGNRAERTACDIGRGIFRPDRMEWAGFVRGRSRGGSRYR